MKILCVSDQIDPLVYSSLAKERFSDCVAVLSAGDLPSDYIDFIVSTLNKPTFFIFGNHNLSEFGYYHTLKKRNKGPHPTIQPGSNPLDMNGSFGGIYVGFKNIRYKKLMITDPDTGKRRPLLISGISGSKKYNNGLNQYSEFQMKIALIKMIPGLLYNKMRYGKYLDIFLTHASPRHIHDKEDACHQGFECFNSFIKRFSPSYLIHGHIHLYDANEQRITAVKNRADKETLVINAYSHIILNLFADKNDVIGEANV
ncbi:metallophosphoesterase [Treponema pectinovorum]|uniref:metallophosphoesterase n=1 Tax=Treponema pectinovorum TaxID=164 RepID=UPI0011CBDE41|nr:metallophosphoesterase [Treponema pectinovorum]